MDRSPRVRGFFRSALLMMGGTALAQAIPLLVAPLLTRMYGPEQFGALAAFIGVVTVISVVSTLRIEPAIVLPRDDGDAANIVAVALVTAVITVLLVSVGALLGKAWIHERWPTMTAGGWLPLVAPTVLCMAFAQTAASWANRGRQYRRIVGGTILLQGGTAAVSLLLGALGAIHGGLLAGRFSGHFASAAWLAGSVRSEWQAVARSVTPARAVAMLVRYRQFPQFNLPYSLIGTASRELLLFAFTALNFPEHAGFYGLARSVLYAPVSFLSASLSQVFYKEAADTIGTPGFEALANQILRGIVLVMTPGFAMFVIWGPEIFALVFGAPWRTAGVYAAIFAPVAYLFLFSSWPERLFEVTGRQRRSFGIQLTFDLASAATVLSLLFGGFSPTTTLVAYAAIACAYHCTYVTAAFRVAGFSALLLVRAAVLATSVASIAVVVMLGCRWLGSVRGLWVALGLTGAYTLGMLGLQVLRRQMPSLTGQESSA